MQSEPILTGFPHQTAIQRDYQWQIEFPLAGAPPPADLWSYKIGFDTEVVAKQAMTAVRKVRADHTFVRHISGHFIAEPRTTPSVFRWTNIKTTYPQILFTTGDWTAWLWNGESPERLWFRHADCDTLFLSLAGSGTVATDIGLLKFKEHDFLYIPRGVTYFCAPSSCDTRFLMLETVKPLLRPHHAWIPNYPYAPSALRPALPVSYWHHAHLFSRDGREPKETRVFVRGHNCQRGEYHVYAVPYLEAVAWEGTAYPFVLSRKNIRTISSADFHLDPTAYTLFAVEDMTLSLQLFLPRYVHSLPYQHNNHCTEILFNIETYSARPDLPAGCITVHPPGLFHGPAIDAADKERRTPRNQKGEWRNEVALLIESREPVYTGTTLPEISGYAESWFVQSQRVRDGSR